MKQMLIGAGVVVAVLMMTTVSAFSLRCGNNLVSEGDLKHQVLLSCSEPVSKEVIGYIDRVENEERIRVMKIEEWIVEVDSYGSVYYYSLVFEGNALVEIKAAGEKKK